MRILWLNPNLLLPLDKGGKLRTWHLLRQIASRHEVTYLSFADPRSSRDEHDGMREVCRTLETVPRLDEGKQGLAFYAGVLARLPARLPYAIGKYRSREYARRLRHLLDLQPFDLVVCDFLVPAVNMPPRLPCASVVFTHNVEAEIWRRHAEAETRPLRRRLLESQWARMGRFEGRTLSRFNLVLAVSDADRCTIGRLYPDVKAPVRVVPTGVDTAYFLPSDHEAVEPARLVFTGSMDWLPNEDAMLYFTREILPRIREAAPAVTVSIVGREPTARVKALAADAGIEVTGSVPDVRPWIRRAAVYVVPLRIGGGTRLKIFEAMAMGKAVVSTSVGAEGLPVSPDHDVLIADDPQAFASAVVALLNDTRRRERLERAARALMLARYDWSVVAAELDDALSLTAAGRATELARVAPDNKRLALDANSQT